MQHESPDESVVGSTGDPTSPVAEPAPAAVTQPAGAEPPHPAAGPTAAEPVSAAPPVAEPPAPVPVPAESPAPVPAATEPAAVGVPPPPLVTAAPPGTGGGGGRHLRAARRGQGPLVVGVVIALVAVTGVGVVFAAGGGGDRTAAGDGSGRDGAPAATAAPTTPTTPTTVPPSTAPPTTPTTAPPTTAPPTTAPTAESDGTLRLNEEGPAVAGLQQRLSDLGYWLGDGSGDGHYGQLTRQAVMAFQKVEGLARDGVAGPITRQRLATAARPRPRGGDGIEIDLGRQVLFVVQGGRVRWAINTSTGSGEAYASPSGGSAIAATPPGHYHINRQLDGVRTAPLGNLYRPKYFNGGIAVHGAGNIPAQPASHGCARVTNSAMDMLWASGAANMGTPVWVY